jgi:hypothetical protein
MSMTTWMKVHTWRLGGVAQHGGTWDPLGADLTRIDRSTFDVSGSEHVLRYAQAMLSEQDIIPAAGLDSHRGTDRRGLRRCQRAGWRRWASWLPTPLCLTYERTPWVPALPGRRGRRR